jgi:hypothetical protein
MDCSLLDSQWIELAPDQVFMRHRISGKMMTASKTKKPGRVL